MASLREALTRLQQYNDRLEGQSQIESIGPEVEIAYAGRLHRSLQSLEQQLKEQEAALKRLQSGKSPSISIEKPSEDTASRIQQLRTITAAYKSSTSAAPLLPSSDSPLPALLALRSTLKTIEETKISVRDCKDQIHDASSHLKRKESELQDAHQVTMSMEARIEGLRLETEEIERDGPETTIARHLQSQQHKSLIYAKELKRLVLAFNKFVDEHLAIMIAAEQLGGPIVGDDLSLSETMLEAGFDKQGKVKKSRPVKSKAGDERLSNDDRSSSGAASGTERKTAAAGMRRLTEELLNALADDENPESYIAIKGESAAVRFLVRSKVAEFHPDDSRKLRLMDFGAEVVDAS